MYDPYIYGDEELNVAFKYVGGELCVFSYCCNNWLKTVPNGATGVFFCCRSCSRVVSPHVSNPGFYTHLPIDNAESRLSSFVSSWLACKATVKVEICPGL